MPAVLITIRYAPQDQNRYRYPGTIYHLMSQGDRRDHDSRSEHYSLLNPRSGWAPSAHDELAREYRSNGRFSRALDHWSQAWELTALSAQGPEKQVADRALAQSASILAWDASKI